MQTGSVLPLLSDDSDSPLLPNTPASMGYQLTLFTPPTYTQMPYDVKIHWLEWLNPQELSFIAQTCLEQYQLSRHPSLWIKFLKPELQNGPDSPDHGTSLETFRTQGHARLEAFTFLGLHDKEGSALFIQKKKTLELLKLLRQKFPNKLKAIMQNLSQPHIQNLLKNKRLDLKTALGLNDNAIVILGYDWIIKLCQAGKTQLALDLTQYSRHLIHSPETCANVTDPVVQELLQGEQLALDQAIGLTPLGRDNLKDGEVRQAYINGDITYEQLCEENLLAKKAASEAVSQVVSEAASEAAQIKACCRIC